MMSLFRGLLAVVFCGAVVAFAGCGAKAPATVAGVVKLDGTPLKSGTITFNPVGEGAVAYGQIDASGNYKLSTGDKDGLKPGDYIVTVAANGPPPDDRTPGPLLTPPKYASKESSDIRKTVIAGSNSIPIDLVSN